MTVLGIVKRRDQPSTGRYKVTFTFGLEALKQSMEVIPMGGSEEERRRKGTVFDEGARADEVFAQYGCRQLTSPFRDVPGGPLFAFAEYYGGYMQI